MRYASIIADPPWTYRDAMRKMKSTRSGASTKYQTMTMAEILAFLETETVAIADDALLWLWTTNAFMEEAHLVARAWGFKPKTIATWVKGRAGARVVAHIGQGRYLRNATEHVLVAARGKPVILAKNIPTFFVYPGRWKGRKHSEKPPVIHEWAERLSTGPRIELFARSQRPGWDAIGDELCLAS